MQSSRLEPSRPCDRVEWGAGMNACTFEEVVLYLCRELSAMWGVVITEISKRLDMRMVSGFVAVFVPIGRFVRAISPFADAALSP